MRKYIKKAITVLLLGTLFITTHFPEAGARYIGYFNGFWVYSHQSSYTEYLEKTVWNGWYVVNIKGTSGNDKVKSILRNSNGDARSEWNVTLGGTKDNYYTAGCQAGYVYRLEMQNFYAGSTDIYGSWSPDHY